MMPRVCLQFVFVVFPDHTYLLHVFIIICVQTKHSFHGRNLYTVELWSLELACLKHHGSLELIRQSWQITCLM